MSKWLEEFNKSNQLRIQKRIKKLEEEYREFSLNFRDFPYERYQKAMDARKQEIEELQRFGNPTNAQREVEDYAEEIKRLKKILGNIHYLALNIDPSDHEILKAYSDGANGVLDEIRAEIAEEKEHAYADFERYKVEYLGQDEEDALDSLPQDDFRYGMERCIDIINKYKTESEG